MPDQELLIHMPLGLPGSGRVRYGAAMRLWEQGALSAEALEVYRICSVRDGEDPAKLLAIRNAQGPAPLSAASPETAIRTLVAEADRYLARRDGPGIADVRAGIAAARNGPVMTAGVSNAIVTTHLPATLAALMPEEPALAWAVHSATPHLNWITYDGYDPALIGENFVKGHAYCSLIGEDAAIRADAFDFGLFLIAPHVLYRDHRHAAPELYAPLTGPHGWRFQPGGSLVIKPAHVPVWNDPFQPHLTKVGPVPFLALFGWTADVNEPATVVPARDWVKLEELRLGASDV